MDDKERANAIRQAVKDLNAQVFDAAEAGLKVKLDLGHRDEDGHCCTPRLHEPTITRKF